MVYFICKVTRKCAILSCTLGALKVSIPIADLLFFNTNFAQFFIFSSIYLDCSKRLKDIFDVPICETAFIVCP